MASARSNLVVPEAYRRREQTLIKHIILERYLDVVARHILWRWTEFVFVDGFSGPWAGRTDDYSDTSFGIALRKLREVRRDLAVQRGPRTIRAVFVEKRAAAFARLSAAVAHVVDIEAVALPGRVEDRVVEIKRAIGSAFALIVLDPKGWNFDLQALAPLLQHKPGEVIVTFMFDHINRFLDDVRPEIAASYGLPFGDPAWRTQYEALLSAGLQREQAVLELFRSQLKKIGGYEHVVAARIQRTTADRAHFFLVYGTRHATGLIKFRDIEKRAMIAEEAARIDAKHDKRTAKSPQVEMFGGAELQGPRTVDQLRGPARAEAIAWLEPQVRAAGSIPYEVARGLALERYALTESEVKDVLVLMQKRGLIKFIGMKSRQHKPSEGVSIEVA